MNKQLEARKALSRHEIHYPTNLAASFGSFVETWQIITARQVSENAIPVC